MKERGIRISRRSFFKGLLAVAAGASLGEAANSVIIGHEAKSTRSVIEKNNIYLQGLKMESLLLRK